jgi:hypothetical protein
VPTSSKGALRSSSPKSTKSRAFCSSPRAREKDAEDLRGTQDRGARGDTKRVDGGIEGKRIHTRKGLIADACTGRTSGESLSDRRYRALVGVFFRDTIFISQVKTHYLQLDMFRKFDENYLIYFYRMESS